MREVLEFVSIEIYILHMSSRQLLSEDIKLKLKISFTLGVHKL